MSAPAVLFCVGATKAGTSWLYRALHDHPDCALPAVKEAHYWDTSAADARDKQLGAFAGRLADLQDRQAAAAQAGRDGQARNLTRQIADLRGLMAVIGSDRRDDSAYLAWLTEGRGAARYYGDFTPSYAILPDEVLARMRDLTATTRFIYLIRDPLDRFWSHIRMLAQRRTAEGSGFDKKANILLARALDGSDDGPIFAKSDYKDNITRLRRVIPQDRLLVHFFEDLFTPKGLARLYAFLGLTPAAQTDRVVHEGQKAVMRDDLRPKALAMLGEQYTWVAQNVGPLPQRWQDNQARMTA